MTFNLLDVFCDLLVLIVDSYMGLWIFGFVLVALCSAAFYSLALNDK